MRPSKLRLPDRTPAAIRPLSLIVLEIGAIERAGIADAGRAAEADEIEADPVELLLQTGILQIFGDHLATGRQRGLHPRLLFQAEFVGLPGDETGADQHRRVGGVGA
jgi:hypothetical protein